MTSNTGCAAYVVLQIVRPTMLYGPLPYAEPVDFDPDGTQRHATTLIALATHGRSGLRRAFLGSIADKVVRGTTIPVLVYRPSGYAE